MEKNLDNDDFSDLETLFQETASTSKTKNPRQIEEDPLRTWLRSKLTPVHYLTPKECQASSVQYDLSVSRRDRTKKGQEEEARPDTPNPEMMIQPSGYWHPSMVQASLRAWASSGY